MIDTSIVTYAYAIDGTARDGQTWKTRGEVRVIGAGQFMEAVQKAMGNSFLQLTDGKATYGKPGVGCVGPYRVTNLTIAETGK